MLQKNIVRKNKCFYSINIRNQIKRKKVYTYVIFSKEVKNGLANIKLVSVKFIEISMTYRLQGSLESLVVSHDL